MPEDRSFLGILMLDTRFPRPPGDIGNVRTFEALGIPVRHAIVRGASPHRVVQRADPALLRPFIAAARALAEQGAAMVTTSCGFLARHQHGLAAAVAVPVVSSSLLQCRALAAPGILTIDAASLTADVLLAAGVPHGVPVQGMAPGGEFHRRILTDDTVLDVAQAEREVVEAACALVAAHPSVREIVLECTNMPPYREAVGRATGRPVHDIVSLLTEAWRARRP